MPPAILAVAAIAIQIAAQLSWVLGLVLSIALAVLQSVLMKPKGPKAPSQRDLARVVRSGVEPWRVVYGERMLSGVLVHAVSTGDNHNFIHLIIVLAAHRCEEIGDVWLNDRLATDSYFIDGSESLVKINRHLGDDDQAADADAIAAEIAWTVDHRLRGHCYLYVRLKWHSDKWPSGIPNVKAVVKGKPLLDPRDGLTRWSRNPLLAMYDYLKSPLYGMAADDDEIDLPTLIASANIADEMVALEPADVSATALASDNTISTVDNKMGLATGDRVRVAGTLPGGLSAGVDYFWITVSTQMSRKAIGRVATSLTNAYGRVAIDLTTDGGSFTISRAAHQRYTCDGVIGLDDKPIEVLEDLGAAAATATIFQQGRYRIYAGAARLAEHDLTIDNLRDQIRIRPRPPRAELFNAVRGIYADPLQEWEWADYPALTSITYESQDGGERLYRDFEQAFQNDAVRAQRNAQILLKVSRQAITATLPCNWSALAIAVWDVVRVTIPDLGWDDKEFIVHSVAFAEEGGVDLNVQEWTNTVYDWTPADAQIPDPAPDTSLGITVGAPTGLTLASGDDQLIVAEDGTVVSRIRARWSLPLSGFLVGQEIEWKPTNSLAWSGVGLAADVTEFFIAPVADAVQYDVRVRARNSLGQRGPYATVTGHMVVGKTTPPPPASDFFVERLPDGTRRFTWDMAAAPADVRSGGGYRLRYALGVVADWSAMTPLHAGKLSASPYETNALPAGIYSFAIKAIDSSDNESDPIFIFSTLGDPPLRAVLFAQLEHALGWPGTKTDCWAHGQTLRAISLGGINDLPATISALPSSIDALLPDRSPITYETATIDLGADVTFNPLITVVGSGTITVEIRVGSSADGAPVGAWIAPALQTGKRYLRVRVTVTGATPRLTQLTILLDGETKAVAFENVNTATVVAVWFERLAAGHFRVADNSGVMASITQALLVLQNVGGAWTWELISKSAIVGGRPAAEFKIRNAAGALADAVVDVELKGPRT